MHSPLTQISKILFAGIILASVTLSPLRADTPTPFLGLQIQGISSVIANTLGLPGLHGVLVRDIAFPGPASLSDIRRGDVILTIGSNPAKTVDDVVKIAEKLKSGEKIPLTVWRRGKTLSLTLMVGALPPAWDIKRNSFATIAPLGLTFAALTDKVKERFNLAWRARGVAVSLVDEQKAAGLDIRVGDVVVQVNQHPVWSPSHIVSYFKKAQDDKKEMLLFLVEGTDGFRFVLLPVPVPSN